MIDFRYLLCMQHRVTCVFNNIECLLFISLLHFVLGLSKSLKCMYNFYEVLIWFCRNFSYFNNLRNTENKKKAKKILCTDPKSIMLFHIIIFK